MCMGGIDVVVLKGMWTLDCIVHQRRTGTMYGDRGRALLVAGRMEPP